MARDHDHHHHHHHHEDDAHDAPLDAANQSLANALRASFRILKLVMFVLVVLYCFSGFQCIDENEEAVVLRFGKLLDGVRTSGLSAAFPYPIDETIVVTTRQDNRLSVLHWPQVTPEQRDEPLNKVRAGGGLDPSKDGALLTADKGMVHMQWAVRYRITDLRKYVRFIADDRTAIVDDLITGILDNAAIGIVSEYASEDVTRGKTAEVAERVRVAVNERLEALDSGVTVVLLDVPKSSVPGQTMSAFDEVSRAENEKNRLIREAEQKRTEILNRAAGEAYTELLEKLDAHDLAVAQERVANADQLAREIDDMIERRVGGDAGRAIREARSFYSNVVQQMRGDVDQYNAALAEYLATPDLFIERMWQQARARIMVNESVRKHFLPKAMNELRIKVGVDPEQRRLDEQRKLREEARQRDFSTPEKIHAIMPGE